MTKITLRANKTLEIGDTLPFKVDTEQFIWTIREILTPWRDAFSTMEVLAELTEIRCDYYD
jgi:hypothetical protein